MRELLLKKLLWFCVMTQQRVTGALPTHPTKRVSIDPELEITPKNINAINHLYDSFSVRNISEILWYSYFVYDENVQTEMNSIMNSSLYIEDLAQSIYIIMNDRAGIIYDPKFQEKISKWLDTFEAFMGEKTIPIKPMVTIF